MPTRPKHSGYPQWDWRTCSARGGAGGGPKLTWPSAICWYPPPPHLTKVIHVGVGNRTFAIVRVPFGQQQAPGQVQHLIATLIGHVDRGTVIVVQYLDGILLVGEDQQALTDVTASIVKELQNARFPISLKHTLDHVFEVSWMGKQVLTMKSKTPPKAVAECLVWWRWRYRGLGTAPLTCSKHLPFFCECNPMSIRVLGGALVSARNQNLAVPWLDHDSTVS